MNEQGAWKAIKNGSQEGLVWMIDHYSAYVASIVHRIIGNQMSRQDVEEVTSDVFLALWNQADRLRTDNIKAYLGRMARNMALNKFREAGFAFPLEENRVSLDETTPEEGLLKKEAARIVSQEVRKMKEPEREILLRFYYYFEPIDQIAREMNLNPATVKTKLFRARKALKTILSQKLR